MNCNHARQEQGSRNKHAGLGTYKLSEEAGDLGLLRRLKAEAPGSGREGGKECGEKERR